MKKLYLILLFFAFHCIGFSQSVNLISSLDTSKTAYSMRMLEKMLSKKGYAVKN